MTPHDELMALAGKATPGEWKSDASVHPDDVGVWACAPGSEEFVNNVCFDNAEANAAFIAAACNFVRSDAFRAMVRDAWLPIESAPRDGTRIMLANASGAWIGEYKPVYQTGYRPPNPWASMMLNHDHLPRGRSQCKPTHWRPLPAPPQAIDAAASGAGEG